MILLEYPHPLAHCIERGVALIVPNMLKIVADQVHLADPGNNESRDSTKGLRSKKAGRDKASRG